MTLDEIEMFERCPGAWRRRFGGDGPVLHSEGGRDSSERDLLAFLRDVVDRRLREWLGEGRVGRMRPHHFDLARRTAHWSVPRREKAALMLESFCRLSGYRFDATKVIGVRVGFGVDLDPVSITVNGTVDRLERYGSGLRVIKYSIAKPRRPGLWPGDEDRLALAALALRRELGDEEAITGEYWYLIPSSCRTVRFDRKRLQSFEQSLTVRARKPALDTTEFPYRTGGHCTACPHLSDCPAHRKRTRTSRARGHARELHPREIDMAVAVRLLGGSFPRRPVPCPDCPTPPNLTISPQGWECPACHSAGGPLDLVMAVHGIDLEKAEKYLLTTPYPRRGRKNGQRRAGQRVGR